MTYAVPAEERFGGRVAVVIGGSMAGLVAARVLSEHFDEVVVVERDAIPDDLAEPRKGAPQGQHLHALLKRGEQILTDLFPGLVPALVADGAVTFDLGGDLAWYHFGAWKKRHPSGLDEVSVRRPLLEAHVRRRLFAIPRVRRLDRCDVLGLTSTPDRGRVTGVRVRRRDDGAAEETIDADLVVDASGRGSRTPAWFESLGYARPEETEVKVQVGYAGGLFRRTGFLPDGAKALYILSPAPARKNLGALFPVDGDRWCAVLGGVLGEHPPTDREGWLAFAKALPVDDLYRALCDAEPASELSAYRFPSNLRRRYERLARVPEGHVVTGDALASFNPIYGQGMTTACLGALELDRCLRAQRRDYGARFLTGLSRRYFAAAALMSDVPWAMTTGEDFRYAEVEGQRPPLYPAMRWYLGQVHRACTVDAGIYGHFLRVMQMLESPNALLHPRMALRVLQASRGGAREEAVHGASFAGGE